MEKDMFSPIFSSEAGTRVMKHSLGVWPPRWVPYLVVEKTGKTARGLSGMGDGGS